MPSPRPPAEDRTVAILVGGWNGGSWSGFFASCRSGGVFDNGLQLSNEEQGIPVEICLDPRAPWSETWADFRHLG